MRGTIRRSPGRSAFFEYAHRRQALKEQRDDGGDPPWTTDPILQRYRFTNVFREDDAVTVWIREREHPRQASAHNVDAFIDRVFWTVAARWFNRIPTLEVLCATRRRSDGNPYGLLSYDHFNWWVARDRLHSELPDGPWTTGSFVVGTPYDKGHDKATGVCKSIDRVHQAMPELWADWSNAIRTGVFGMQWATKYLTRFPNMGAFMAYEVVCDLRWSLSPSKIWVDRNTWANPGPGAVRGLGWIHNQNPKDPPPRAHWQHSMRQLLNDWRAGAGPMAARVEMREVEHTLCEYDKYERVRHGLGEPRQKFNGEGGSHA